MCATVFNLYNVYYNNYNNNYLSHILLCLRTCSLFLSHNYSLFCSQRRFSNHDCSFQKQRVFTQDWLNYKFSSSALSYLFIVLHNNSKERSSSRTFVFSPSRKLYCDFIVVCILCTHCLLLSFLVYPVLSRTLLLLVYLCNKLFVVVYRF